MALTKSMKGNNFVMAKIESFREKKFSYKVNIDAIQKGADSSFELEYRSMKHGSINFCQYVKVPNFEQFDEQALIRQEFNKLKLDRKRTFTTFPWYKSTKVIVKNLIKKNYNYHIYVPKILFFYNKEMPQIIVCKYPEQMPEDTHAFFIQPVEQHWSIKSIENELQKKAPALKQSERPLKSLPTENISMKQAERRINALLTNVNVGNFDQNRKKLREKYMEVQNHLSQITKFQVSKVLYREMLASEKSARTHLDYLEQEVKRQKEKILKYQEKITVSTQIGSASAKNTARQLRAHLQNEYTKLEFVDQNFKDFDNVVKSIYGEARKISNDNENEPASNISKFIETRKPTIEEVLGVKNKLEQEKRDVEGKLHANKSSTVGPSFLRDTKAKELAKSLESCSIQLEELDEAAKQHFGVQWTQEQAQVTTESFSFSLPPKSTRK